MTDLQSPTLKSFTPEQRFILIYIQEEAHAHIETLKRLLVARGIVTEDQYDAAYEEAREEKEARLKMEEDERLDDAFDERLEDFLRSPRPRPWLVK